MKLIEKLAGINKMVEVIQKNKSGYGYKYLDITEILSKVTAGMDKFNVSLRPEITPDTFVVAPQHYTKTKVLKDGTVVEEQVNEYVISARMNFIWINNDDPTEKICIPWVLVGAQADPSQAFGSGLTYCQRYFLLSYFHIATPEDDPDNWRSKKQAAADQEGIEISKAIINEITDIIGKHINDDNRAGLTDALKKVVKKNGKASADYTAITQPEMASAALDTVKKYFNITTTEKDKE